MVSFRRTRLSNRPVPSPRPKHGIVAGSEGRARCRLECLLLLGVVLGTGPRTKADDARTTAGAPGEDSKAPATVESVQSINRAIDALTNRLESLAKRRSTPPQGDLPPALSPLQSQVDALSKGTGAIVPLKTAVSTLDERVRTLDAQVVELRKQLDAFKTGATKRPEKPATPPDDQAEQAKEAEKPTTLRDRTAAPKITNPDLALALELFKVGKYQEASRLFQSLTESQSDDARVWYYAALCHGLTTQTWEGETLRLVRQGAEREKAGTPAKAEIDATLASIPVAKLKAWIDHYRKTDGR